MNCYNCGRETIKELECNEIILFCCDDCAKNINSKEEIWDEITKEYQKYLNSMTGREFLSQIHIGTKKDFERK